jgi:hypothetical protein
MACRVFRGIRLGTIEDTVSLCSKPSSGPACRAFKNASTSEVQGLDTSHHSHIAIKLMETWKSGEFEVYVERKLRDSIEGRQLE